MALSLPQVLAVLSTVTSSAPAAMACAKPAMVESPEPVAFTAGIGGVTAR